MDELLKASHNSFYKLENGQRLYYDIVRQRLRPVPRAEGTIVLSELPESSIVWQNKAVKVHDLGDGILQVGWSTKMNTIGAEVIQGLNKAIDLAEQD